MENFFKIRAEKQSNIVNAAFKEFGKQGYKKASLADIAKRAEITKGMITYYFGSKKMLYMYLVDVSQRRLIKSINNRLGNAENNFFNKMEAIIEIQVDAIKEHPAMVSFANSMYSESDPEVMEVIQVMDSEYENLHNTILTNIDTSQFSSGVNPHILCRFIFWAADGFISELYEAAGCETQVNTLTANLRECLNLMAITFCKNGMGEANAKLS